MEIKLLLLKTIGTLYYTSHSGEERVISRLDGLVNNVMGHLSIPDNPLDQNREKNMLSKLRAVVVWMRTKGINTPFERDDLLTRIRMACGDNDRIYELFQTALKESVSKDEATSKALELMGELTDYVALEEFVSVIRKSSRVLGFERETIADLVEYRDRLIEQLQSLPLGGKSKVSNAIRSIDLADLDSLEEVFRIAQTSIDPRAILRYGFKGMNRMTGEQGGARRGEWANVSALPGQNKSGNLLDTFIAMCIFNKPVLFDESKKPLHVYTTIEDKLELVVQKLYVMLMQHEYKMPVKISGVRPREMAKYVLGRLTANGWNVKFEEFRNGDSTESYIDMLRGYQEEGFEIVSAGCDYVNLLGTQGITAMVAGDEVQLKHRRIRSFTAPANIFHYTAHQLSTDAKTLARQFPDDYIKKLPGKGYYEGCKKVDTEFDFEWYVAKTVKSGATWQEFQWGKHRKLGATNEKDKYFAMRFLESPMIGFEYDVDLDADLSFPRVGGRVSNGDGGADWADFE